MSEPAVEDPLIVPILEDPPEQQRGDLQKKYEAALDLCRKNPRKWVRVREFSSPSSAYSAAKSLTKRKIPGKWEFTARTVDKDDGIGTKVGRLYAKYDGTA